MGKASPRQKWCALGVSRQSVSRWHRAWEREGKAGLQAAGGAGRKPKLTPAQLAQVEQELLRGLDADAQYLVSDVDANQPQRLTGRQLMEQGLVISIASPPGAAVIAYEQGGRRAG
ncbi:MAG TPA: helix-turn-helix domain-containing protein [Armatimonadota bacterium]|nr:helix-turn-helix domain-containing protein [Armatimonadota bacterium]